MMHFPKDFVIHRSSVAPQSSKLTAGIWKISSNLIAPVVDKIPGMAGPLTFFPNNSASRKVQHSGSINSEVFQNGEVGWLLNKPPMLAGGLQSCATTGKLGKVSPFDHESLREPRTEDVRDAISNKKTSVLERDSRPVAGSRKCPYDSIRARLQGTISSLENFLHGPDPVS